MFTGVYMPCVTYMLYIPHTPGQTLVNIPIVCSYTLPANIHLHTPRCRMQQGAPSLPAVPTLIDGELIKGDGCGIVAQGIADTYRDLVLDGGEQVHVADVATVLDVAGSFTDPLFWSRA